MMIMYILNFAKDSWMCSQKDLIGCGNIWMPRHGNSQ